MSFVENRRDRISGVVLLIVKFFYFTSSVTAKPGSMASYFKNYTLVWIQIGLKFGVQEGEAEF